MGEVSIIGVDLAKNVIQLHGAAADGSVVFRKKLSRPQFARFMADHVPCEVAMEACPSAHHWAEVDRARARARARAPGTGHRVRLIAPHYVKPFLKRQKNDAAGAEAIAEAATRPTMRFVEPKTTEQQARAVAFRVREQLVKQRADAINALRAYLYEFGHAAPEGIGYLPKLAQVVQDPGSDLPDLARDICRMAVEQVELLTARPAAVTAKIAAELDRHAQRRAIEIDASVSAQVTLRDVMDDVRALAQEKLPSGIGLIFLGEAASLDETSSALTATYVIALLVVFVVLPAQFESMTSALVVMLTVPFGVCAAIYAMFLTGTTINTYSQIDVLMLIGVMAKNGILRVEFANQLRDGGRSATEAAFDAAKARLRPITMTLICTVVSGLPLIFGAGRGAEARMAIGWVIVGGLGLAAVFTLFLTPADYALVAGLHPSRASAGMALDKEMADLKSAE